MNIASIVNWTSLVLFYVLVGGFLYSKRKEVFTQWYVFFMYRTQTGIKFIKSLASKAQYFWRGYGYVAIPVGFLGMITILGMLISSVVNMFANPETAAPAASVVVPWGSTGVHGAIITVSIWYFLSAVLVTVLVHEGAHAVIAAAHKFKIKSTGFGMFAVIPFFFVEPDDEQINSAPTSKKMSIFAAGPFTNIVVAFIAIALSAFLILPPIAGNMQVNGVEVMEVNASMPAALAGLQNGDIITQVDMYDLYESEPLTSGAKIAFNHVSALSMNWPEVHPNQIVNIKTLDGKDLNITSTAAPSELTFIGKVMNKIGLLDAEDIQPRGVLGISKMRPIIEAKAGAGVKVGILGIIYTLFSWITIFNLGIGLFNLLPIGPLDGGLMVRALSEKIFKKKGAKVFSVVSITALITLLLSIFGVYLVKLF